MTLRNNKLPQIIAELEPAVRAALETSAQDVVDAAKARVPIDTGKLYRAIHVELTNEGVEVQAGNNDVFYGHIVEHGGINHPPHPFLVPALEENRELIIERVAAALRKVT
jgi:HK97 gp10 family phage protein